MKLCHPEFKFDGTDKVLWPLSYTNPKLVTGFEPATAPLTVEVSLVFAPGRDEHIQNLFDPGHDY